MSVSLFTPASGYPAQHLLSAAVSEATRAQALREPISMASNVKATINQRLATTNVASGLQQAATNAATQAARSVSDKISGAVGGKLSSVLGAGGAMATNAVSKKITNMVTGKVQDAASMMVNKLGSTVSGALGKNAGGLLGNTISQLSDGAAKNLAGAKIVAGFLETGPKDQTLVTDPYGVSDNNILNSITDSIGDTFKNAIESLRQSPGLITDLTSMIASGKPNFSILKDNLTNRIVGSLGGRQGILNSITGGLRENLVEGRGLPPDIFDTALAVVNGQVQRFDAQGMSNARQVYDLMGQITSHQNLNGFFDVGSESALMASTMRELIVLGVPDSVAVLVEKAVHDEIAYNALYANMRVAVEYSDLDTINLMIDHLGASTFVSQVPDAVYVLLSNYELPVGTTDVNYDNEWNALKACLDRLSPGWGMVTRNGELISDLSFFSGISGDAKKLMMRDEDYRLAAAIAPHYNTSKDLIQELKTRYPMVPLD